MRYFIAACALYFVCVAAVRIYQANEARNQRDKERFVYDKVARSHRREAARRVV